MTRDEVVTLLGYRLGNRTDLGAKIILEMQYVQTFILEGTGAFLPWFLETEMANTVTAPAEERIALPDDFLGEIEEQSLWIYDSTDEDSPYVELRKSDYDRIILRYPISAKPREYALAGDYILLRPVPDDVYTIKMRYFAKDTVLSTNIENKWLKHAADLMIAEVGVIMAGKHLYNQDLEASFRQEVEIARQRLYTKHEARRHSNRTYGMGED